MTAQHCLCTRLMLLCKTSSCVDMKLHLFEGGVTLGLGKDKHRLNLG